MTLLNKIIIVPWKCHWHRALLCKQRSVIQRYDQRNQGLVQSQLCKICNKSDIKPKFLIYLNDPTIIEEHVGARSRLTATEGRAELAIRLIPNEQIPTTIKRTGLNIDNKSRFPVRQVPANSFSIPIAFRH